MYSIPVPHYEDASLFSYIGPSRPFTIISSNKQFYYNLYNLENCFEYLPANWLCERIFTMNKINSNNEECEIQMLTENNHNIIPKSCNVKNFIAEFEIWHELRNNEWLYSITYPTQLSIVCEEKTTKIENVQKLAIFELQPKCKAFTSNFIFEVQSQMGSHKLSNIIPMTIIDEDDCGKLLRKTFHLVVSD
ncbi:hypothetical protein HHI36_004898 [Cryptolaemus montrouzieri]|uniref:Uncharacterized protein n=1 Tax=Cryptolaemus montrouzieri TaxID=559131 RepID=A0ABD2NSI5_9CUCU